MVKVSGRFRANNILAAIQAAVQGYGVATAPLYQVLTLVDMGKVELTLTRFEPPAVQIHAVWPDTRVLAAKTRSFVDFLAARLKAARL
jgi:DNA-binding transcriptional LysR family regulator